MPLDRARHPQRRPLVPRPRHDLEPDGQGTRREPGRHRAQRVERPEAGEADEGQVFEQGTEAGKEVAKGTTISYKVSSGPDTTSVPDLTDMTEAQARMVPPFGMFPCWSGIRAITLCSPSGVNSLELASA